LARALGPGPALHQKAAGTADAEKRRAINNNEHYESRSENAFFGPKMYFPVRKYIFLDAKNKFFGATNIFFIPKMYFSHRTCIFRSENAFLKIFLGAENAFFDRK